MAFCVQLRTIPHLFVDDRWNGRLFIRLRLSHSRCGAICITTDVAIHRLGILCRNHQYRISAQLNEVILASKFARFTHESKNDNANDNQTDTNNSSSVDFLIVQEVRHDGDGRNTNS